MSIRSLFQLPSFLLASSSLHRALWVLDTSTLKSQEKREGEERSEGGRDQKGRKYIKRGQRRVHRNHSNQ